MKSHDEANPPRDAVGAAPLYGRFELLHPRELAEILDQRPLAFVPSGTLEWHSLHLPVGLDGLLAEELCWRAAQAVGGVVVPTTYWAVGGVPHPFTLRIESDVVEVLFVSILEQLSQAGFKVVIILAGHYGLDHHGALKRAALRVMERNNLIVYALPEFELTTDLGFRGGDHAGVWETSILWALRPDLIAMDRLPPQGTLAGVQGEDPRKGASEERGRRLVGSMVERLAHICQRLLRATYEERSLHREVMAAQIAYLDDIRRERASKPLVRAHPLVSEAYQRALDALWRGNYSTAIEALEAARLDVLDSQGTRP